MPRPEEKPPTEKCVVINGIIIENEIIIKSHQLEIEKLTKQIDKLEQMNEVLKE